MKPFVMSARHAVTGEREYEISGREREREGKNARKLGIERSESWSSLAVLRHTGRRRRWPGTVSCRTSASGGSSNSANMRQGTPSASHSLPTLFPSLFTLFFPVSLRSPLIALCLASTSSPFSLPRFTSKSNPVCMYFSFSSPLFTLPFKFPCYPCSPLAISLFAASLRVFTNRFPARIHVFASLPALTFDRTLCARVRV